MLTRGWRLDITLILPTVQRDHGGARPASRHQLQWASVRVGFVNQPIDRVLPPVQTSVGACTYGLARSLASSDDDVIVYARNGADTLRTDRGDLVEDGVRYRFIDGSILDRALQRASPALRATARIANRGVPRPASASPLSWPQYGRRVAAAVADDAVDVVALQHFAPYAPMIRRAHRRVPIVLHLHAELYPQSLSRTLLRSLQDVDVLAGVSDCITRRTQQLFPSLAERCATVHDGIDPADFPVGREHTAGGARLLYVGAVSPHKGVHDLISAFEIAAATHLDVTLEIVGPLWTYPMEENFPLADRAAVARLQPLYAGDYVARLRQQVPPALAARVTFAGTLSRADLLRRYQEADIFVFPSIWDEGFGLPPVEAMAAGLPVIATRSGAVVETVVDGETGVLVDKGDVTALGHAISSLLDDDRARSELGRGGRERVMRSFTWDHAASEARDVYRTLAPV